MSAQRPTNADMNTLDLLDRVMVAIVNPASPPNSPYLDPYFAVLKRSRDADHRAAAEQRIWEVWCTHDDVSATEAMEGVLQALSVNDLVAADSRLDDMIRIWPDWAEAWNKRATLRFVQERYDESLSDILRTLELESRHFGAISGFGQICLRTRDPESAIIAFEQALQINPNLRGICDAIDSLRQNAPPKVH